VSWLSYREAVFFGKSSSAVIFSPVAHVGRVFVYNSYLLCATFIPVTRRVKGYTRFVGKYVTGRRKRFRPHKVYIFLIRITSQVDLAMSVCPPVRMNAEISETIRAGLLRFCVQIPELLTTPTLTPTNRPKLWLLQF